MWLRVYKRRVKVFWQLRDRKNRVVARAYQGMRTFRGAKDQSRFVMEGLRNCLRSTLPILILSALLHIGSVVGVWAQTHPCDGTPPTSGTAVAGTLATWIWCSTELDTNGNVMVPSSWATYDNGARSVPSGVTAGPTKNAAGLRDYRFSINAPATAGVHTLEVAGIGPNGEGAKSSPFALTVTLPLTVPAAPVKSHVQ